jgi:AraC family transcriptional activator of pobA
MVKKGILSLPELAARYHIKDVCGGSVAYFSSVESGRKDLRAYTNRISCYELQLICQGDARIRIADKWHNLGAGDLVVLTPYQPVDFVLPEGVETKGLLLETHFYESIAVREQGSDTPLPAIPHTAGMVYHLEGERLEELGDLFSQVRRAIRMPHIYKLEMVGSLMHACLLFISELPYEGNTVTRDFKHKENIFRIFMHLANNNFREQRQIQFYADKLCISPTYLSRIVKELSGNTVGEHLALLTFNEACSMLRHSSKTIGEISMELAFNDQSAFTYFFKQHAGVTPNAYRNRH